MNLIKNPEYLLDIFCGFLLPLSLDHEAAELPEVNSTRVIPVSLLYHLSYFIRTRVQTLKDVCDLISPYAYAAIDCYPRPGEQLPVPL